MAVPPEIALHQQRQRREQDRDQVEFAGRYQGQNAYEQEQIKRNLKVAAQSGRRGRNEHGSGDHGGETSLASAVGRSPLGAGSARETANLRQRVRGREERRRRSCGWRSTPEGDPVRP